VAINGGGFFREVVNGAVQYSRNGQFHEDATHTLVNAQGAQLTGYLSNTAGVIQLGAPVPLTLDKSDLTPVQTTEANFQLNLSSAEKVPATMPFDANDPTSYNKQTVLNVRRLGTAHIMTTYYVKTDANTWDVYAAADNKEIVSASVAAAVNSDPAARMRVPPTTTRYAIPRPTSVDCTAAGAYAAAAAMLRPPARRRRYQAQLDACGSLLALDPTASGSITGRRRTRSMPSWRRDYRACSQGRYAAVHQERRADPQAMALLTPTRKPCRSISAADLPRHRRAADDGGHHVRQDHPVRQCDQRPGLDPERLFGRFVAALSIDENGVILGQYSNGKSRAMGQIHGQLCQRRWPDAARQQCLGGKLGLGSANDRRAECRFDGQAASSAVETSNTDLTAELVNMITAQRVYQANAQTIKTEDSILQTLVNLR
jgi:flagellar hook protein FlgE